MDTSWLSNVSWTCLMWSAWFKWALVEVFCVFYNVHSTADTHIPLVWGHRQWCNDFHLHNCKNILRISLGMLKKSEATFSSCKLLGEKVDCLVFVVEFVCCSMIFRQLSHQASKCDRWNTCRFVLISHSAHDMIRHAQTYALKAYFVSVISKTI